MSMQRVATLATDSALRAAYVLRRSGSILQDLTAEVSHWALDGRSKRLLTTRVYDRLSVRHRDLFAWEPSWFDSELPKAPARILLGGCGRGREVGALLARGYEVWAFDPAIDSVRECWAAWPSLSFLGWFGYEELIQSWTCVAPERRLLPPELRFDAALLGWGSLSHVLEERDQDALFRLLARIVPDGPILASFYFNRRFQQSRAARLGARLGAAGGARPVAPGSGSVRCSATTGFTYTYSESRVQALAAAAGREAVVRLDLFPRATFRKPLRGAGSGPPLEGSALIIG